MLKSKNIQALRQIQHQNVMALTPVEKLQILEDLYTTAKVLQKSKPKGISNAR